MARRRYLVPSFVYPSLREVELEKLKSLGVEVIILDLDNTLLPIDKEEVDEGTKEWVEKARKEEFKLCILSNTLRLRRLWRISRSLGIPFLRGMKPMLGGFKKAISHLGVKPHKCALIGDRLLTDVLGGNRMGMITVLVKPMKGKEGLGVKILRLLEWILLKFVTKGQGTYVLLLLYIAFHSVDTF